MRSSRRTTERSRYSKWSSARPMMIAWCSANRPSSAAGQCRDLGAQPAPGQLGQLLGVTLTRDQGPQHRPTRHTQQVGDNRIKFDASVFEDFGDALPSLVWAWTSRWR